jgi:hypothetical protein
MAKWNRAATHALLGLLSRHSDFTSATMTNEGIASTEHHDFVKGHVSQSIKGGFLGVAMRTKELARRTYADFVAEKYHLRLALGAWDDWVAG